MWYVISYNTPFGEHVINFVDKNEFGTIMIPVHIMFQSDKYEEAEWYYNRVIA